MRLSSWKKKVEKTNNNISQYFKGRIQSQRLVVETGFPTALVDLIVKNRRQRLKRSPVIEVRSSWPPLPTPPSPPILMNDTVVVEEENVGNTGSQEIKDEGNCKGLLMAALMVGFFAVLAIGARKFAVGLTLSAFALIFVEYLSKRRCFRGLIPCFCDSTNGLKSMMVKVLRFILGIREAQLEGKNSGLDEIKPVSSNTRRATQIHERSAFEIQGAKLKSLLVDSNDDDKSGSDRNLKRRKPDSLAALIEEAYDSELKEREKQKSGKAKMTKLKNVFIKKSSRKENKAGISENNLEHRDGIGNSSSFSSGSYEGDESSETPVVPESDHSYPDKVVAAVVVAESSESQKRGNYGYLFLCIIVLIGLNGGRISALLIILGYCLVKKSSCGMLKRYAGLCL